MRRREVSITQNKPRRRLILMTVCVATASMLIRRADGTLVLPISVTLLVQSAAVLLWLFEHFRWSASDRIAARAVDGALLVAVALSCFVIVSRQAGWAHVLSGPLLFILGLELGGYLRGLLARMEERINSPRELLGMLLRPWLALIVCGTLALSLPIATLSGVPDYAHNFWLHVVTCGFTATSAACLVGNSIYSMSEDFTRFGQGITLLVVELAGLGFAAIGLSLVRLYLRRELRLGTLYRWLIGAQVCGFLLFCYGWPARDVASISDRVWTSLFYCIGATFNAGFILKPAGLAHEISVPILFLTITTLVILGSIGWPFVLDVLHVARGKDSRDRRGGLAEFDIFAALALLLGAAMLLLVFETPGSLPSNIVPSRPVDFGERIVSIRDQMSLGGRWSLAVFVSATLRSAGLQSIPLSPGGISLPSYFVMLLLMLIGGSFAGTGGGLRTTSVMLPVLMLLRRQSGNSSLNSKPETGKSLGLRLLLFVPVWIVGNIAAILILRGVTDGTWYEIVFEAVAALNSVGLTSGLSLHLTTLGRLVMILFFVVGRLGPIICFVQGKSDKGQS